MQCVMHNVRWHGLLSTVCCCIRSQCIASMAGLTEAQKTLGSMAPTYFVAVAGIVAAFFGAQAFSKPKK